ncbi:hypothetical protein PCH_Pc13g01190 [Penicillium rubens Wisconsin 54-1255]|uniref:Uncharacterized protein n=1 Tax=Penicillium rubens (strain ATCC 28089 / DSM 1075 / NRRL 1951 / Wisconsin 54-1255) TaxID=500485 RepID=B6H1M7_PENRW|nr:hypothetical protein PCH_Pc13g01190 [Penicillium rubens Wisconsin 54-1255]
MAGCWRACVESSRLRDATRWDYGHLLRDNDMNMYVPARYRTIDAILAVGFRGTLRNPNQGPIRSMPGDLHATVVQTGLNTAVFIRPGSLQFPGAVSKRNGDYNIDCANGFGIQPLPSAETSARMAMANFDANADPLANADRGTVDMPRKAGQFDSIRRSTTVLSPTHGDKSLSWYVTNCGSGAELDRRRHVTSVTARRRPKDYFTWKQSS